VLTRLVIVLKLRLFFCVDNTVLVVYICGCFIMNVSFIFIKVQIFAVLKQLYRVSLEPPTGYIIVVTVFQLIQYVCMYVCIFVY